MTDKQTTDSKIKVDIDDFATAFKKEVERRVHEFTAVYGTVFGSIEGAVVAQVRTAIENELNTIK